MHHLIEERDAAAATFARMNSLPVLDPQSPEARAIFHLAIVSGIIFALIFIIVAGMIVYALMRFRWREGEADPQQLAGNKTVEIVWTAIPCVIVLALILLTWQSMNAVRPARGGDAGHRDHGHQWWWEARYPKSGVIVANEIHIPAGRPLSIRLESADVLHEFWVAQLTRKMATVPDHPNHIWIQADAARHLSRGLLGILRNATCVDAFSGRGGNAGAIRGLGKAQAAAGEDSRRAAARRRARPFQEHSCMNCHAINGTAAEARVGPDLTHFASRRILGAGVVENTPANLRRWLTDPQQVKPGVKMPDYDFSETQ